MTTDCGQPAGLHPLWVALPNFVATERFRPPADDAERRTVRREWGVPENAFVVGCVAALKRDHKRLDYLIAEMRDDLYHEDREGGRKTDCRSGDAFLLLAGATTPDTPVVESLATEFLQGRYRIVKDAKRDDMPDLYRCLDVFVLPSLFEMMPIAVLEAMAGGVPVIANRHPVLRWMIGEQEGESMGVSGCGGACGGMTIDMARSGALAEKLAGVTPEWLRSRGRAARGRACAVFARDVVVHKYVEYYARVLSE
jgi:glycosyltransferase involved in cell wall biosynthesis